MKKLPIFCLIVCIAIRVHAQQAASAVTASSSPPALPPGPLLKRLPDNIKWTLITTEPAENTKPEAGTGESSENKAKPDKDAKATSSFLGEKAEKKAHVLITSADGIREEEWTDGNLLVTIRSGVKAPIYTTGAIEEVPMPTWISAANFTEIVKRDGKDYLIFRSRILPSGSEMAISGETPDQVEKLKVDATAVIDADTRLPVAVKEGDATTTYAFEPLPPNAQIISPALQAEIADREQKVVAAARKPVRP